MSVPTSILSDGYRWVRQDIVERALISASQGDDMDPDEDGEIWDEVAKSSLDTIVSGLRPHQVTLGAVATREAGEPDVYTFATKALKEYQEFLERRARTAEKLVNFTRNYSLERVQPGPLNLTAAFEGKGHSKLQDIVQVQIKKPESILDLDFLSLEERVSALIASVPEEARICKTCGQTMMPFYSYETCSWFLACKHSLQVRQGQ